MRSMILKLRTMLENRKAATLQRIRITKCIKKMQNRGLANHLGAQSILAIGRMSNDDFTEWLYSLMMASHLLQNMYKVLEKLRQDYPIFSEEDALNIMQFALTSGNLTTVSTWDVFHGRADYISEALLRQMAEAFPYSLNPDELAWTDYFMTREQWVEGNYTEDLLRQAGPEDKLELLGLINGNLIGEDADSPIIYYYKLVQFAEDHGYYFLDLYIPHLTAMFVRKQMSIWDVSKNAQNQPVHQAI